MTLPERPLDGVDRLLHPGAVLEVAFVARNLAEDLGDEAGDEIGVEQRSPRLFTVAARRIELGRHGQLAKLDLIGRRRPEPLADALLLDEAADEGALRSVDARFDAGIVADGDEARLNRAQRAVAELAQEDIAIVDIHPHHAAGGAHHPFGDEVAHRADDRD